jgi:hypothetical protein
VSVGVVVSVIRWCLSGLLCGLLDSLAYQPPGVATGGREGSSGLR